jgi:adhesin transport system membrane fusion protein
LRKRLDVMPGMTVTVDIRTGRRSALSYMLKPIRRTLDEAFSEP